MPWLTVLLKLRRVNAILRDFDSSPCIWLSSSTKGLLPLNKLIGSKYIYEESNESFEEINKIFNAAVQSHLLAAI